MKLCLFTTAMGYVPRIKNGSTQKGKGWGQEKFVIFDDGSTIGFAFSVEVHVIAPSRSEKLSEKVDYDIDGHDYSTLSGLILFLRTQMFSHSDQSVNQSFS